MDIEFDKVLQEVEEDELNFMQSRWVVKRIDCAYKIEENCVFYAQLV